MQLIEENLRLKEQVSTLNFICPVETRQRLGDVNHFPLSKKKTFSLCLLCSFIWLNDDLKLQVSRMSRMEEMQPGPDSEIVYEEGQSSESVTNASYPRPPPDNDYSSDTSLRLGWVLPYFQFQLLPEFMCQETTEVSSMMNIQVQMMSCLLIDFACGRLSLFSSKWWLETKTERKQLDGMPASPNDQCMHCKTATNNTVLDCQMMMCVCWESLAIIVHIITIERTSSSVLGCYLNSTPIHVVNGSVIECLQFQLKATDYREISYFFLKF